MKLKDKNRAGCCGFTMIEILVAMAVFFGIIGGIYQVFFNTMLTTKAGTSQALFNMDAMLLQQHIVRDIEQSKFAVVSSIYGTNDTLTLYEPSQENSSMIVTRLQVLNCSKKIVRTRTENGVTNGPSVLESNVTSMASSIPVFSLGRKRVSVALHVGDTASDEQYYGTGPGYQGVDLQFSVVPRNLQIWYD